MIIESQSKGSPSGEPLLFASSGAKSQGSEIVALTYGNTILIKPSPFFVTLELLFHEYSHEIARMYPPNKIRHPSECSHESILLSPNIKDYIFRQLRNTSEIVLFDSEVHFVAKIILSHYINSRALPVMNCSNATSQDIQKTIRDNNLTDNSGYYGIDNNGNFFVKDSDQTFQTELPAVAGELCCMNMLERSINFYTDYFNNVKIPKTPQPQGPYSKAEKLVRQAMRNRNIIIPTYVKDIA